MSNRFHQKFHRSNHHSIPLNVERSIEYPDAGYDPIASRDFPFQGEFYSQGNIVTTESISAYKNLYAGLNANIKENANVGSNLTVTNNLSVYGDRAVFDSNIFCLSSMHIDKDLHVYKNMYGYNNLALTGVAVVGSHLEVYNDFTDSFFTGDLVVKGDLIVEGESTTLHTTTYVTSAVEIVNRGTSDALKVTQIGADKPIARFVDGEGGETVIGDKAVITAPAIILTSPHVHKIAPTVSIVLPTSAIDVELYATTTTLVSAFTSGVKGITYTLTNVGTKNVTLTANSALYIRNGRTWRSNTLNMSSAFLQLNPNHSCSLRVGDNQIVSIW